MCGKFKWGKIINDNVRERVEVAHIIEKVMKNRWFEHIEKRPLDSIVRRVDLNSHITRGRWWLKKIIIKIIGKDWKYFKIVN